MPGCPNFLPDRLTEARKTLNIVANQVGYHLFDRRIEREVMPHCDREGIGIMAYGSLAHGVLTGTMSADTTFEESDWRATGYAFGLPLFHSDHFIKNLETVDRLSQIGRPPGRRAPNPGERVGIARPHRYGQPDRFPQTGGNRRPRSRLPSYSFPTRCSKKSTRSPRRPSSASTPTASSIRLTALPTRTTQTRPDVEFVGAG